MNGGVEVGLLAGGNNENGMIKNVYSKGNIIPSGSGYMCLSVGHSAGYIENTYTLGKFNINVDMAQNIKIGTFGVTKWTGNNKYCYYLNSSFDEKWIDGENVSFYDSNGIPPGISTTEETMKKPEFVNSLNEGQEGNPWKQDTNNINGGYPILSWQK